jgi:DNA-binding transcriptional LysR family regulator
MDVDLLKTFLEVNRTRHFRKAAENLFLTQAAVSARIRQLEEITGVPLFTRERNNIQLTVAGKKLLGHAETMINTWNRARHEIAAEDDDKSSLAVGGVASLWDMMLDDWVIRLYARIPKLLLHAEVTDSNALLQRVRDGTLDLSLMYESPQLKGLAVEEFSTIQLLLVSTRADISYERAISGNYVYVDWGTSFSIAHAQAFPELPSPVLRVEAGRLARAFILSHGGSAYLADQLVADDIQSGRLHPVSDAPTIDRLAYAVYSAKSDRLALIQQSIRLLKKVSNTQTLSKRTKKGSC